MKTLRMCFPATVLLSLNFFLFSCTNNSAENREDAEDDVKEANEALEIANKEYLEDIENYRSEVKVKIAHNDSLINSHKEKMKSSGLSTDPFYKNEIEKLEAQNRKLKDKMDNYKGDGKDDWTIFKEEFNHDMKELGDALKDLTVKNTK